MKKPVVLLLSVVHLLLAFSSSCASASTTPNQVLQVVRDIGGNILRSDTRYFVVSVTPGGGVITRGPAIYGAGDTNFVCPFQVVLSNVDKGTSVYFKPKAPKQVVITESSDLNIEFYLDNPTICNNTVWEVEGFPGSTLPMFLSTNGVAGDPLNVATWFQIKKANFSSYIYKLVFCPYEEDLCLDIGINKVGDQFRLAVGTENTFYVAFVEDHRIGIKSII